MADRLLVPVDGSEQSERACELALREFSEASFVLLHVINPVEAGYSAHASVPPSASEAWYERQKERANDLLDDFEAQAEQHGVEPARAIEVGTPTKTIVEFAGEHDLDHIVMGSHGREGVTRILLGSVAEAVVRHSPVPVTVAR